MAEKKLRYAFIGDADSLLRSIRKSDTALGKFSRGIGKVGSAAATGFAVVGAAAVAAGVQAIQTASDANEAAAAFYETFGVAAQRTGKFVEDFANKAGLADFELQQLLATSGAVLQGIDFTADASADLSMNLATLAGDVASFSNVQGGAAPVLKAFESALLGEREALKTYGIAINEAEVQTQAFQMTGKTSASELTKQEKALATYELLLKKTTVQQGDLNRTQDSFANISRRVSAEIKEVKANLGDELLPVAADLMPVISTLVSDLAEGFAPIMKELAPIIQRVVDLFAVLGPVFLPLLEKGFQELAAILNIVVGAVEFVAEGVSGVNDEISGGEVLLDRYAVSLDGVTSSYQLGEKATSDFFEQERLKNIQQQRSAAMTEHYAKIYKDNLNPAIVDGTNAIQKEQDMLMGLIPERREAVRVAAEEAEAIQKDLLPNLSSLFSARDRITAILDREKSATKALQQAKEDLVDINKSLLDIDENIAMANDDLASANQDVKDKEEALEKAKEKAKEVTDEERLAILRQAEAVQRLTDEQDGSEIKTIELRLAQERLNQLRQEAIGTDRNVEEAERDLADAQREAENVAKRINDLLERKEELREKEIDATEKVTEAQDKLNEVSTNNVNVMLQLAEAQEKYNEALEKLADGKYEMALDKIAQLAGEAVDSVNEIVDPTTILPSKETPVEKTVKEVQKVASQVAGDPTRGAAKISGMGGLSTFGEPSVVVNFNGAVTNPQDAKDVVVQGLKEFNRTDGNLNRIINLG